MIYKARQLLPGLAVYPLLEQQMDGALRNISARSPCDKCDLSRIIARFREELEHRQRRDNQAGRW